MHAAVYVQLRAIDPGTHRTAKLLSGHLSDVKSMEAEEVKPRVLSAEEVRLAQLRASAVSGAVRAPTAAVTSQYTYSTACESIMRLSVFTHGLVAHR